MKTFKILLATIVIMGLNLSFAQTARLQVIHNAADPGAVAVDIYLNGTLLLDNFGFREATPYIDAPAGTPINIGVAGPNSTSAADTIKNFNVTLTANETYVAIANGVLDPTSFASNPMEEAQHVCKGYGKKNGTVRVILRIMVQPMHQLLMF
jgi:hypothetical protein